MTAIAQKLRADSSAVRVSFHWLGTRKTLSGHQREQAAQPFDADSRFLSASQKLFDTRHPAFKAVTAVRGDILAYWRCSTLPYVEDGVRLLARSQIDAFDGRMKEYQAALADAVQQLDQSFHEIRSEAKKRLGSLFNPENYPPSVLGTITVEWSFPSVEPPEYLLQINPKLYEQEQQRIAARFEEAVALAEAAFVKEFQELVEALHERLTPDPGGQKKVFRDSAVENLTAFFQRFKQLNVGNNAELEKLIAQAAELTKGVKPEDLRALPTLKNEVCQGLGGIKDKLGGLIVLAPRRKIIKPTTNGAALNGPVHNS